VGKILSSGNHLLQLINHVLEMSKIEAGRMVLSDEPFDLHEAIGDVVAMMRPHVENKGLALSIEGVSALPRHVRSDVSRLRQILLNLLGNAVKFTDEGRVELRVRASETSHGIVLHFEVEDTGIGISPEDQARVFEPFEQMERGVASRGGTGLGVPISRELAVLMGGHLTLKSELGKGTTFVLQVLVQQSSFSEASRSRKRRGRVVGLADGERPPRILVVDDQEDNRSVLSELLSSVGVEVSDAVDGREAVDQFGRVNPDLVFMDVKMPVMDGVEASAQIRSHPRGAAVPIVMLSASVLNDDRSSVLQGGGTEFIPKPFREAEIWEALERNLGVRFLRMDTLRPPGASLAPTRGDVSKLGTDFVSRLREAVELGDIDRASELLRSVETTHADVVHGLRERLDGFDLEGLLDRL
jgi:CheY-like chemotaxis protein